MHTNYGSCRTRAPPSLSGLWRRESLLRILALLHHNTHDVSTFHTHFPTTITTFRTCMAPKWHTTVFEGLEPDSLMPQNALSASPARPTKCFSGFSLPPDLKIAGNSIFILLSKNFFLSYRAPLPNFRTSRGVPAPSSPVLWAAAEAEKQCRV